MQKDGRDRRRELTGSGLFAKSGWLGETGEKVGR